MNANELRKKFINFFISKKHTQIASASLVPENDPTILFTTAGMHPLVPYLLGEKHPAGKKLVNVQKCLRTDDIDEVGDDTHNTFFEMLGNWSLGDSASSDGIGKNSYFKKEAISYSYEFLTKILKLDKNKIAVSCFGGDSDSPKDIDSYDYWIKEGINKSKIAYLPKENNWWGPAGSTGPCGPDTEIFYWISEDKTPDKFDPRDSNWVEIWNNVFMQYSKTKDGKFIPLNQKNVDTGMGLERTLTILQNKKNIYDTEIFSPLIDLIKKYAKKFDIKKARIIADHFKASVFIISDGIEPSNIDQGYILRRLLRRAIRYMNLIELYDVAFISDIIKIIINIYKVNYPEIDNFDKISEIIKKEKEKFEKALNSGEKQFSKIVNILKSKNIDKFPAKTAFGLFESYGFPFEIIEELTKEENLTLDKKEFEKEFNRHQLISRTGSNKKFSGGLADNSLIVTKYHTVTHLLHQALRNVLGNHVSQKGSNITVERLRFDFNHPTPLTKVEIAKAEQIVNHQIKQNLDVTMSEMTLSDAKVSGALGYFESKYGKFVKVYTIGKSDKDYFSREICGGPHIKNTKELGKFKITSEKSSSSGIRRIKAVLE